YLELDSMVIHHVEQQKAEAAAESDRPAFISFWFGTTRFEVPTSQIEGDAPPAVAPPLNAEEAAESLEETEATVQGLITTFVEKGYQLRLASVGGLGLLLLVWAALALAVTVEQCFNRIFGGQPGRPWHHRIMLYWAVLTLGPVLAFTSLYMTGKLWAAAETLPIIHTLMQMVGSLA